MPGTQHDHGSGAVPVGAYQPGGRQIASGGLSKGVEAIPPAEHDVPVPTTRRQADREQRRHAEAQRPKRTGRTMGGKNRRAPTQEMFDGPPDGS